MKINKKELLYSLNVGDMITYEDYECIIVDNSDDGDVDYRYLIMDINTCKILDSYSSLEQIKELPDVFLIAKNDKITLTLE